MRNDFSMSLSKCQIKAHLIGPLFGQRNMAHFCSSDIERITNDRHELGFWMAKTADLCVVPIKSCSVHSVKQFNTNSESQCNFNMAGSSTHESKMI
jgi:hypothetical protein